MKDRFGFLNGAIGCLTLQVFSNKSNPIDIIGIEINPRFGGGYPFSLNAGANFPEYIIREYILNEQIEYFDKWKNNCLNIRYENEITINDYNNTHIVFDLDDTLYKEIDFCQICIYLYK